MANPIFTANLPDGFTGELANHWQMAFNPPTRPVPLAPSGRIIPVLPTPPINPNPGFTLPTLPRLGNPAEDFGNAVQSGVNTFAERTTGILKGAAVNLFFVLLFVMLLYVIVTGSNPIVDAGRAGTSAVKAYVTKGTVS